MRTTVIAYLSAAVVFLVLDGIWLSIMAGALYRPALGPIMLDKPVLWAAVLFYVIYLGGVVVLAVQPALGAGGWASAARSGAVLGFVAYATYDLTNQATLRNWSVHLTILDLIWGTFVTTTAATAATLITGWLSPSR